jgi:GT2 family glycosyltransferase
MTSSTEPFSNIAPSPPRLRLAVGLATAGRRAMMTETLRELERQTRAADIVVICPAGPDDVDEGMLGALNYPTRVVRGGRGLCVQRNAILDALTGEADVVVFFDDDFFPCRDFLEQLEGVFTDRPDAAMVTGRVLADGITSPGIAPDEARAVIAKAEPETPSQRLRPVHNGYGCNMAARMAPIEQHGLRFDPALPLYGWLEDVDFSRRLAMASGGKVLQSDACRGVHLGTKSGRLQGVRFGYSQIANPLYIARKKGVLTPVWVINQVMRNVLANIAGQLKPEPWIDRRGRLRGNIMATRDLIAGRMRPEKILELS